MNETFEQLVGAAQSKQLKIVVQRSAVDLLHGPSLRTTARVL